MTRERSFIPLFVTNLFGTMNDNFLKTLASFIVIGWIQDASLRPVFMGVTAGALVLPFILCSPLADRLTVVFPKRRILQLAKWAEIPIVGIGIAGFALHSAALVIAAILLMGLQSSLYSPAKYALVRDIGGVDRISTGMGGMEGVSFLGVLAGTIAASVMADVEVRQPETHWSWVVLVGLAVLGLLGSYRVKAKEEKGKAIHAINPLRYVRRTYRMAKGYPGLNAVILTLSVFWWAAAMLQMGLLVYGKEVMGLDSTHTGMMLCAAAVGIVVGQVLAGLVDRRHFLLGATLFTGWIAAVLLAVLFFVPMGPTAFGIVLALLAFDLGFFKLPLDAEIQKVVKGAKLNTMLAYFNQVSFFFMLLASGCYALVSWLWGPRAFLLLLAAAFVVVPGLFALNYRSVMVFVGRWIFSRRYDVKVTGSLELIEPGGTAGADSFGQSDKRTFEHSYLVLPNHPAMVDPMLVCAALGKIPLRPLADESFFKTGVVAPMVLRTFGAVAVPDLRKHRSAKGATVARGLNEVVLKALRNGGSVIFYPSGHIQTEPDREEIGTRQLAYNICRELPAGVEVIGIRTRGLWGSIWSRNGRTASPKFVPTLLKSVFLWFFVAPFVPRRKVSLHIENLTARAREWSKMSRLEFNRELENWYNTQG